MGWDGMNKNEEPNKKKGHSHHEMARPRRCDAGAKGDRGPESRPDFQVEEHSLKYQMCHILHSSPPQMKYREERDMARTFLPLTSYHIVPIRVTDEYST